MGIDGEQISNLKRAEEALAKLESTRRDKEDLGLGEARNMSPESPFIQQMKQERIVWETKQAELLDKQKKVEQFKVKKAKRVETTAKRQADESRNRKIKASVEVIEKMNADIKQVQILCGKIIKHLDSNAPALQEEPYFKLKAQRTKRMLTAYYYGLNNAVIRPKLFDGIK